MMSTCLHTVYAAETPYWHRRIPFFFPHRADCHSGIWPGIRHGNSRRRLPAIGGIAAPRHRVHWQCVHCVYFIGDALRCFVGRVCRFICRLGGCVGCGCGRVRSPGSSICRSRRRIGRGCSGLRRRSCILGSGRRDICFPCRCLGCQSNLMGRLRFLFCRCRRFFRLLSRQIRRIPRCIGPVDGFRRIG